ncbi:MAG: serine/threonine-protein kinase [Sandaracinaceae bacterium]
MIQGLPSQIGPYEPLEPLATGGMARVVVARLARAAGFERRVALKLILSELAEDDAYTAMFLDEARVAARIQHPHVVSVLDVGRDETTGLFYMAMDLVLGATLAQVLRTARPGLPVHVALELIAQTAEGLDAAHCATAVDGTPLAIVHRDVSPQNILVGLDGFVRVTDFGIARAVHRSVKTQTGHFKGKLAYSSPEHVLSNPLDHRSDIFALGVVAFETLTRVRLFAAPTPADTLNRILTLDVPDVRTLRNDVPEEAARILRSALERDRDDRPSRASEIAEGLRHAAIEAGWPSAAPAIRELVREVSSDQVIRLAGMDDKRNPSAPPVPSDEAVTQSRGPLPRDTIIDFAVNAFADGDDDHEN